MALIDIKHPHAKRIVVIDDKGEPIPAVFAVNTTDGWVKSYEVEQKKRIDLKNEKGEVTFPGEKYFMIKTRPSEKGGFEKIEKLYIGKFTVKWKDDHGNVVDVPANITL